ncbi:MAG: hypothetical protein LBF97_05200, partial [Elusimicrobiota bacterium]|nr:hypothetical protein [Elusimicrobiota bacterium]
HTSVEVLTEIYERLKLNSKFGLTIILEGDTTDLGDNDTTKKFISTLATMNTPLLQVKWNIGPETLEEIKKNETIYRPLLASRQLEIATLFNGYILTSTGVITDELHQILIKKYQNQNQKLNELVISRILNNELYTNNFNGEILNLFFAKGEPTLAIKQIILQGPKLEGEAKKIAELAENQIGNQEIKILQVTENGLLFETVMPSEKIASLYDGVDIMPNIEDTTHITLIDTECIEIEGIVDTNSLLITKIGMSARRAIGKLLSNIGLLKENKIKGIEFDESIQAIAAAA